MKNKKQLILKLIISGLLSCGLYWSLFFFQDTINDYFTRGGICAFLPLLAAFAFSIVHGPFTSYFWSVLGVEAKQKKIVEFEDGDED
jgi:hypothetical protein